MTQPGAGDGVAPAGRYLPEWQRRGRGDARRCGRCGHRSHPVGDRANRVFFSFSSAASSCEPTVAVDPQSRNKILEGIQKLNEEGATIVYTTHYMEEAKQI